MVGTKSFLPNDKSPKGSFKKKLNVYSLVSFNKICKFKTSELRTYET